jgi:heme exporter protein B
LTTLFFALLILVIFNFAFDPGNPSTRDAASGILWVSLLFPGVVQLNRSFQSEREEGTFYGLILAPLDRSILFAGKFLANWIQLLIVDFFVLVAFAIFFNLNLSIRFLWLLPLVALASLGFASVGTLFACMVSSLAVRDVLLPVLLFPIVVPVVIAAVTATREVLGSGGLSYLHYWLQFLLGCDVIFVLGTLLVFDFVVGD